MEAYSCNQIWGLPVKSSGFKPYLLVTKGIRSVMVLIRCFEGSSIVKFSMLQKLGLCGKTQWEAVSLGTPGAVWKWSCAMGMMAHSGFF